MVPGDEVTFQGTPATVVQVNNNANPPSVLIVVSVPQARWVPQSQVTVETPPPAPTPTPASDKPDPHSVRPPHPPGR